MDDVQLAFVELNDQALDEVAHLLMVNRRFAARDLNEDATILMSCSGFIDGKFYRIVS